MNDVFGMLWSICATIIVWAWSLLHMLFAIPFFGFFLQLAFYGACGWLLYKAYRMLPAQTRVVMREKVLPYASWLTDPLRWYVTLLIAKPEWIRRPGDPTPQIIERKVTVEVPVRMRRSFRQWAGSGIRWGIFYASICVVYLNWQTLWQYVSHFGH